MLNLSESDFLHLRRVCIVVLSIVSLPLVVSVANAQQQYQNFTSASAPKQGVFNTYISYQGTTTGTKSGSSISRINGAQGTRYVDTYTPNDGPITGLSISTHTVSDSVQSYDTNAAAQVQTNNGAIVYTLVWVAKDNDYLRHPAPNAVKIHYRVTLNSTSKAYAAPYEDGRTQGNAHASSTASVSCLGLSVNSSTSASCTSHLDSHTDPKKLTSDWITEILPVINGMAVKIIPFSLTTQSSCYAFSTTGNQDWESDNDTTASVLFDFDALVKFYHGTDSDTATALLTADLDNRGTADFGKGFYTIDEKGYSNNLGDLLAIRTVKKAGKLNWAIVEFPIPQQEFITWYLSKLSTIVEYDDAVDIDASAPSNAPIFTSTNDADQPNENVHRIPVGQLNWFNFAWNNWWLFRRSPSFWDYFVTGSDGTLIYSPLWILQPSEIPDYARPMIRGHFFAPKRDYTPGFPFPLGEEWAGANGLWQWVWNADGLRLLNDSEIRKLRNIIKTGTIN